MGDRINIFREKFKTVVNLTHMNEGRLKNIFTLEDGRWIAMLQCSPFTAGIGSRNCINAPFNDMSSRVPLYVMLLQITRVWVSNGNTAEKSFVVHGGSLKILWAKRLLTAVKTGMTRAHSPS